MLEDIAAYDTGGPGLNLSGGDRPEQLKGIHVSYEFFRLFGARPFWAAPSRPRKTGPRGGNVVVLSNGLWQRRFGSDPAIVGRAIALGGEPYTVIGVLAPASPSIPPRPLPAVPGRPEQHQPGPLLPRRRAPEAGRFARRRQGRA